MKDNFLYNDRYLRNKPLKTHCWTHTKKMRCNKRSWRKRATTWAFIRPLGERLRLLSRHTHTLWFISLCATIGCQRAVFLPFNSPVPPGEGRSPFFTWLRFIRSRKFTIMDAPSQLLWPCILFRWKLRIYWRCPSHRSKKFLMNFTWFKVFWAQVVPSRRWRCGSRFSGISTAETPARIDFSWKPKL